MPILTVALVYLTGPIAPHYALISKLGHCPKQFCLWIFDEVTLKVLNTVLRTTLFALSSVGGLQKGLCVELLGSIGFTSHGQGRQTLSSSTRNQISWLSVRNVITSFRFCSIHLWIDFIGKKSYFCADAASCTIDVMEHNHKYSIFGHQACLFSMLKLTWHSLPTNINWYPKCH